MNISALSPYINLGESPIVPLLVSQEPKDWVRILHTNSASHERTSNLQSLYDAIIKSKKPEFASMAQELEKSGSIRITRAAESSSKQLKQSNKTDKAARKAAKKMEKERRKLEKKENKHKHKHKEKHDKPRPVFGAHLLQSIYPSSNNSSSSSQRSGKDEKIDPPVQIHPQGIMNLGSSCYLNTVLQLIRRSKTYSPMLTGQIRLYKDDNAEMGKNLRDLQTYLKRCIDDLRDGKQLQKETIKGLLDRLYLCNIINNIRRQQDTTEVLTRLANRFLDNIPQITIAERNSVTNAVTNTSMGFIPPFRILDAGKSINALMKEYCDGEVYDGYINPATNERVRMQKTRSIATLPNTIQMQIQRAEITYEEKCIDEKTKQEKTVEKRIPLHPNVPEFLDFGPYLSNPPAAGEKTLYRLDFIMCRSGGNRAEEGGHNWLIKQEGDNKWIKYDDGAVSEYTWEQVQPELNKNVYALFYEKIR